MIYNNGKRSNNVNAFCMIYILGQNQMISENRSILIAALILVYMILFGHGLPGSDLSHL
jgi:hypothetical protein